MPKGQKKHLQKVDPHIKQSNQNNLVVGFSEEYLKTAIVEGILEAEKQKKELLVEEEKQEKERIRKRNREILAKKEKPDGEINGIKLVWRFLWTKKDLFIDAELMPNLINAIAGMIFALIEYVLYIYAIISIASIWKVPAVSTGENAIIVVTKILRALASLLVGRILFRAIKIECIHNKDKNYMLNFLILVIALATMIITIAKP